MQWHAFLTLSNKNFPNPVKHLPALVKNFRGPPSFTSTFNLLSRTGGYQWRNNRPTDPAMQGVAGGEGLGALVPTSQNN